MALAGRTKVAGMSFGISRSCVIYLALKETVDQVANTSHTVEMGPPPNPLNKYKENLEKWVKRAGLDIDLDKVDLEGD